MNYKVIEKNEYGVLVESENSMSDCSECKYAKDRDVSCLKKCDSNIYRYYLPDSEVEKLEYESDLKAKNEALQNRIKELEATIENMKAANEWISVDDDLPDNETYINLKLKNGDLTSIFYETRSDLIMLKRDCTHWKPIN